jgi:hypothetical protein
MELHCIYCDEIGGYRDIHRHLVDAHLDQVKTKRNEKSDKMLYAIHCLYCEIVIERQVKPRSQNKEFLQEFKTEIALVAFDRLIHHLVEEHPKSLGLDPAVLELIE